MKKKSKVIGVMLGVLMFSVIYTMDASAAEEIITNEVVEQLVMEEQNIPHSDSNENCNMRVMLYNCLISVNSSSDGMRVSFMTDCSQFASKVGVKDVVIKQKVWYGWKTVATSSGGYNTNNKTFMGTILYTNAIKDEEYRITCTHYADADEYVEVHGELDVIFTY